MVVARFIGSFMMHLNVEPDVRLGIDMMKFAVNHHQKFNSVYPAFFIGWLYTVIAIIVEFNVMLILTTIPNVLNVIIKYVSLAAIANIPRFYYASLVEHKLLKCGGKQVRISSYRHQKNLKNAPLGIKFLRLIYKAYRMFYCVISYYFFPFMAISLNFVFMVSYKTRY